VLAFPQRPCIGIFCSMQHDKEFRQHLLIAQKEYLMNTFQYIVESIDGDYAHLRRIDIEPGEAGAEELKLVARALLPAEIVEGSKLLYEWMQYSILE